MVDRLRGFKVLHPACEPGDFLPPCCRAKFLHGGLGDDEVKRIFNAYSGMVRREADLVCSWFAKAAAAIHASRSARVGLVATTSIRDEAN